ncbi:MAG: sigma-70 family RNA polymerase sigma factor [Planctomycetaceae bacterium]
MPLDATQLAELIDRHAAALRCWVRSRGRDEEDVVQEAFCRLAVEHPPPDKPAAWLYRVCRNLAEKQRRSDSRRRKREQVAAASEATCGDHERSLEYEETMQAVESLDPELRMVLVARIWGGLSLEEVGELCGVSTATAFRRYHAALDQLRSKLIPTCERPR